MRRALQVKAGVERARGASPMKRAYEAGSLQEAYMVRDLFESRGLVVELRGEDTSNMAFQMPSASIWPSLWVADEEFETARNIVAEYEKGVKASEAQAAWRCGQCGEESEGLFSACWSCGTERDGESAQ